MNKNNNNESFEFAGIKIYLFKKWYVNYFSKKINVCPIMNKFEGIK